MDGRILEYSGKRKDVKTKKEEGLLATLDRGGTSQRRETSDSRLEIGRRSLSRQMPSISAARNASARSTRITVRSFIKAVVTVDLANVTRAFISRNLPVRSLLERNGCVSGSRLATRDSAK